MTRTTDASALSNSNSLLDRNPFIENAIPTYDTHMEKVWYYLDLFVRIVFITIVNSFALITNIINVMVLLQQGIRSCVSLCLVCISSTDLVFTLVGFMTLPAKIFTYLEMRPGLDPFALFFMAALNSSVFYDVSNTLTAFLSLERCLCVCLPLQFKDIFTTQRTVVVVIFTYILCFGLMMPHYLSSGLEWRTSENSTYLALWLSPDRIAVDIYLDIMHFCLTTITLGIVFLCTFFMLFSLKQSLQFQKNNAKGTRSVAFFEKITSVACNMVSSKKQVVQSNNDHVLSLQNNYVINTPQKSDNEGRNKRLEEKDLNCKNINIAVVPKPREELKNKDNTAQSSRNMNVMKTVIMLCVICFICNLSRVMFFTSTRLEPRFGFGRELHKWYQFTLAFLYVIQLLNCSLNIFVYYRYNRSFRAAIKQIFRLKRTC